MPQKTVFIPELGNLIISKRRGSKNLRLSINSKGQIRVSLPAWLPYSAGIKFAVSRREWIEKHADKHVITLISDGSRIGKSYRLEYQEADSAKITSRTAGTTVTISSHLPLSHPQVQQKALAAAERALKKEAGALLPKRLADLSAKHRFEYKTIRIKKLSSRWGSCSSDKTITLNYFLMQLPWELIDYVLLHELVHTEHLNHSPIFWERFDRILPGAKQKRRELKAYRPILSAV